MGEPMDSFASTFITFIICDSPQKSSTAQKVYKHSSLGISCIFLAKFMVYWECGLTRPNLREGGCCLMAYIFSFVLSVAANVASYYICKWLDGWLKGRKH